MLESTSFLAQIVSACFWAVLGALVWDFVLSKQNNDQAKLAKLDTKLRYVAVAVAVVSFLVLVV